MYNRRNPQAGEFQVGDTYLLTQWLSPSEAGEISKKNAAVRLPIFWAQYRSGERIWGFSPETMLAEDVKRFGIYRGEGVNLHWCPCPDLWDLWHEICKKNGVLFDDKTGGWGDEAESPRKQYTVNVQFYNLKNYKKNALPYGTPVIREMKFKIFAWGNSRQEAIRNGYFLVQNGHGHLPNYLLPFAEWPFLVY